MRLSNEAHTSRRWRVHEIAGDFAVEDVWALPAHGAADEFPALLVAFASLDFPAAAPLPVRALWGFRDLLGRCFGLGRITKPSDEPTAALPIPGTTQMTLEERLPPDLRGTVAQTAPHIAPLRELYRTDDEYAAELSNRTVHSVMHLGWVEQTGGLYRGQMAVLVKPRGQLGESYMALIKPFRHTLVYPALMRAIERAWERRPVATTTGIST